MINSSGNFLDIYDEEDGHKKTRISFSDFQDYIVLKIEKSRAEFSLEEARAIRNYLTRMIEDRVNFSEK